MQSRGNELLREVDLPLISRKTTSYDKKSLPGPMPTHLLKFVLHRVVKTIAMEGHFVFS
jgi:hypothetical protein